MAALCAALLTGCSGSDPSDSVMELVKNGNVEQAQQIYAEKISGKEEYESSFVEKFIPYLENLIEGYNNGELPEEKLNDEFETYKKMLGENVTFKDAEERLNDLEISKHCFETAEKLRLEGELTQAYRMYARVIKKDRCYETAQQYITQIPEDYLSESEDLFESGQYQEAVRQSILGYALLDDKSGFDEIAIKVTKRLAEDYGFDNAAVLVEADSFYNTHYDVSVKCDSHKGKSLESMSRNDIVKLYKGFHDIFFNTVTNAWKGTGGSCLFLLEDIYSDGKWYNVDINSDEVEIRSDSERSNYRQEMKEWSDKRYSSSENKTDNNSTNKGKSSKESSTSNNQAISQEYKNALSKGLQYAKQLHMSKQAIYDQLTSSYGEGFPADAARYAVDNMTGVDWNANALEKAKQYYYDMAMSKSAVYDQLTSSYGEQFTASQAQYAIDHLD